MSAAHWDSEIGRQNNNFDSHLSHTPKVLSYDRILTAIYDFIYLYRIEHVGNVFCRAVVLPSHQSHNGGKKSLHTIFVRLDLQLLLLLVVLNAGQKPEVVFNAQHQINL